MYSGSQGTSKPGPLCAQLHSWAFPSYSYPHSLEHFLHPLQEDSVLSRAFLIQGFGLAITVHYSLKPESQEQSETYSDPTLANDKLQGATCFFPMPSSASCGKAQARVTQELQVP